MYRQHFGLTSQPLGKDAQQLWDDGPIAALKERFQWLLENPGVALLTGDPGVGKTSALRLIADGLNPHRYQSSIWGRLRKRKIKHVKSVVSVATA